MTPKKAREPWSAEAGHFPYKVTVEEVPGRQGALQLRWWDTNVQNWRRKSLQNRKLGKFVYAESGKEAKLDKQVAQWAIEQAMEKSQELSGSAPSRRESALVKPLTVDETWDLITHPKTGLYPHDSEYRRELKRSLDTAVTVWGAGKSWSSIEDDDWTTLIRSRVDDLIRREYVGVRSAEITIIRIITAVRWLRKSKRKQLPGGIVDPPDGWKDSLKKYRRELTKSTRDPEPFRPRHTVEEMQKILSVGMEVDPRGILLVVLGAEQRPGQVRRAMRKDLRLPAVDWDAVSKMKLEELDVADFGEVKVFGMGQKGGTVIDLTWGQRQLLDMYLAGLLAPLEEKFNADGVDYPLFPAGKLLGRKHGKPVLSTKMATDRFVSREWVNSTFKLIERKAGVAHVDGRATYGMRRGKVDEALAAGITPAGLQAMGGWSSIRVPMEIYRDHENKAGRREARTIRSKTRGEGISTPGSIMLPETQDGEQPEASE